MVAKNGMKKGGKNKKNKGKISKTSVSNGENESEEVIIEIRIK